MDNRNSQPRGIQVTPRALAEIHAALSRDGISPHGGMRLAVEGGGCAGLTCQALVESAPRDRDRILQLDGARLFLDPRSFIFLFESTLDYQETPPAGFTVKSKHGTNGFCGCPSGKPSGQPPSNGE